MRRTVKFLAHTATLNLDDDALKVLETFAIAFDNLHEDADGVANLNLGQVCTELLFSSSEMMFDILKYSPFILRC